MSNEYYYAIVFEPDPGSSMSLHKNRKKERVAGGFSMQIQSPFVCKERRCPFVAEALLWFGSLMLAKVHTSPEVRLIMGLV